MKIIGLSNADYGREYIAIVSHDELCSVSDKRWGDSKLKLLEIGQSFDLKAGANFRDEIKACCEQMVSAMTRFDAAKATLTHFATMIAARSDSAAADQPQVSA